MFFTFRKWFSTRKKLFQSFFLFFFFSFFHFFFFFHSFLFPPSFSPRSSPPFLSPPSFPPLPLPPFPPANTIGNYGIMLLCSSLVARFAKISIQTCLHAIRMLDSAFCHAVEQSQMGFSHWDAAHGKGCCVRHPGPEV